MSRFAVVYDACVLYPAPLRDLLLQLATAHLFRAQWTEKIHDEWMGALLKKEPSRDPAKLRRTRELMNKAVMDSCIVGYEHLIEAIDLPDLDDRHVVAAALHAKADAIVTFNLKDFPQVRLQPLKLEAIHPDDFIVYQMDLNEASVIQSAAACCGRLKNPPKTGKEYLDALLAQGLPQTVASLRPYENSIGLPQAAPMLE